MPTIRPELLPLPARLKGLPVDARGFVVPFFVSWIDGAPEFRVADPVKFIRAVKERRCWICGQSLGVNLAFVVGPMCGVTRTTAEPPCHLGCAEWSARHCPFLSRPQSRRRWDEELTALAPQTSVAGIPILRNPGITLIWLTRRYKLFADERGRPLINMGPPDRVLWYAEGRRATREEVEASVETGLPALVELAQAQDRVEPWQQAEATLQRQVQHFTHLYPRTTMGTEVQP